MKTDSSTTLTAVQAAAPVVPPLHLPDRESTVQAAFTSALGFCADKLRLADSELALEQLREGNEAALGFAHYDLAVKIGEALGSLDPSVLAVYLYQCDATTEDLCFGRQAHCLPIHLIVHAERKTSALSSLSAALDRAVTHHYSELIGPGGLTGTLDVQVVDSVQIETRMGTAALLTSLYNPPLQVWRR